MKQITAVIQAPIPACPPTSSPCEATEVAHVRTGERGDDAG
jgi:hypothetical protein